GEGQTDDGSLLEHRQRRHQRDQRRRDAGGRGAQSASQDRRGEGGSGGRRRGPGDQQPAGQTSRLGNTHPKKERSRVATAPFFAAVAERRRQLRIEFATLFAPARPRMRKIRKRTAKMAAKTFAIANEAPATPVNPRSAAIRPITKNVSASFSMPIH